MAILICGEGLVRVLIFKRIMEALYFPKIVALTAVLRLPRFTALMVILITCMLLPSNFQNDICRRNKEK